MVKRTILKADAVETAKRINNYSDMSFCKLLSITSHTAQDLELLQGFWGVVECRFRA